MTETRRQIIEERTSDNAQTLVRQPFFTFEISILALESTWPDEH
jgi:hypothetical protein